MGDLTVLFVHLIATAAKLLGRGGTRSVVAESLLLKHQLLVLNRARDRAPNLRPKDRVIVGPAPPGFAPFDSLDAPSCSSDRPSWASTELS